MVALAAGRLARTLCRRMPATQRTRDVSLAADARRAHGAGRLDGDASACRSASTPPATCAASIRRTAPAPASRAAFFIGSHLDTVPNAGAFDGVLGVVLGDRARRAAWRQARSPFAIEVVGFSEEEGVRFGVPFLGSRALVGTFDAGAARSRPTSMAGPCARRFGTSASIPSRIADAQAPAGALGYLEFHIEQGPVLENLDLPLGVVDVIVRPEPCRM